MSPELNAEDILVDTLHHDNLKSTGFPEPQDPEDLSAKMQARRVIIQDLLKRFENRKEYLSYHGLTAFRLKKKSKEYNIIYRYVEALNMFRIAAKDKSLLISDVKRITTYVHALTENKAFHKMDFEDTTTDYFDLLLAIYAAMNVVYELGQYRYTSELICKVQYVASEIGLRLTYMYIDKRV